MTRVIVTDPADADTAKILDEIAREAGPLVARKYNAGI
jgi:plasmid stabilization system protein ParE